MRYYTHKAKNVVEDGIAEYITISEDELRKEYYPIWLAKNGRDDCDLVFEDFLFEWVISRNAIESE